MEKVIWGIIGCGDVAEVKSGPAFQKAPNSQLYAVMRRNAEKAKDFALRHQVPLWYDRADDLLANPEINAVYIATPPSTHLELALEALRAGKHVYLEKPMTLNSREAEVLVEAVRTSDRKLSVAHYRRKLPAFLKVKELLEKEAIGAVRFADVKILQSEKPSLVANSEENWRVDPEVSGGGYFHDLAPHQLDLMVHFFGEPAKAEGFSVRQGDTYDADDLVNGIISFKNGVQFRGLWSFNVSEKNQEDSCRIYGSKGMIEYSFLGNRVELVSDVATESFRFDAVPHVQQPMIEATVAYFLGKTTINPCRVEEGLVVMNLMDDLTSRK